jgi:integrase
VSWVFECLEPLGPIGHTVMEEFETWTASRKRKSAQGAIIPVRGLFRFIAESERLREGMLKADDVSGWHTGLHTWWKRIKDDATLAPTTRNTYLGQVKGFLAHLRSQGRAPRLAFPKPIKGASNGRPRRPTLAESGMIGGQGSRQCPDYLRDLGDDVVDLWHRLRASPDVSADPGRMLDLLDLHLEVLRKIAQEEARGIWDGFQATARMLEHADTGRIERFLAENYGRSARSLGSGRGSRSIFGSRDDVLAYVSSRYGGVMPSRFEDEFLYRLVTNRFGGVAEISELLHSTTDTAISFIVILLIETVMNVAPLLDLRTDDMRDSEQPGHKWIRWWKDRAKGVELGRDFIIGQRDQMAPGFQGHITAPQAFACLLEMRERLVPHVPPGEDEVLLLVRTLSTSRSAPTAAGLIAPLNEKTLDAAWDRFKKRHPILADLPITLSQIRSTVALKRALETNGDLMVIKELLGHASIGTTERYIKVAAVGRINEHKIRRATEFLTIKATDGNAELQEMLGISAAQAAALLALERRKPFGIRCRDDRKGAAPGTTPGETCTRFPHCAVCDERFVVESVETATEMHAFKRHILNEKPRLEGENLARWSEVWAPLVLFFNVALDRMRPDIRARGRELSQFMDLSAIVLD